MSFCIFELQIAYILNTYSYARVLILICLAFFVIKNKILMDVLCPSFNKSTLIHKGDDKRAQSLNLKASTESDHLTSTEKVF